MLISNAYAQAATAPAPDAGDAFIMNAGLIVVLVVMFYFLLIRPQQKRIREHTDMLGALKTGDRVVTGGGLIGRIEHIVDEREVIVDLGNGQKVTALRSTIQGKHDDARKAAANDAKKSKKTA